MPENEFEKKVSSEMQELKFRPSEKVWLRVEERIQKKKKRRVFIIIFFFAGLALLGYWQRSNLFGETGNEIVKAENQKEEDAISTLKPGNSSTTSQNTETTKQEVTKSTIDKTTGEKLTVDQSVINKKNTDKSKNENYKPKDKSKKEVGVKSVVEKTKIEQAPDKSVNVVSAKPQNQNDIINDHKTNDTAGLKEGNETITPVEIKQSEIKIDSTKTQVIEQPKNSIENKDTLLKIKVKDSAAAIVQKDPSGKKWKWGLYIAPGISSLNGQSLSFGSQRNADVLSYQNPVGSGATGGPPVRQKPSEVRSGFAFQLGGSVQRQLSSRNSFSLGLQYGFYSTHIRIGNRRDSLSRSTQFANMLDASNVYNAGGDTIKFTNQYHFIELPLNFRWQLNKNKTKPFIWSTGFTIGQLIASNAMMYDTAFNGIYYKNKNLLNKTQFSLSTGFSWTIANSKQAQWSIGPVANIHLNKLFDSPFENKKYLFFVGARAAVLFNQKK